MIRDAGRDGLPAAAPEDIAGDLGDQASRLQALAEQEAIAAALQGHVSGSNALDDRGPYIDPLEGRDALDEIDDASDDPLHGGGADPAGGIVPADGLDPLAAATAGLDRRAAVAADEGTTVDDDLPLRFEDDGDPDVAEADVLLGGPAAPEDLADLAEPVHDPDDPADPDGYGVPPSED